MSDIHNEVTERISSKGYAEDYYISHDDVTVAICKLKPDKKDGGRGLSTNHFKHGSDQLATHTANLFSGFLLMAQLLIISAPVLLCLSPRQEMPT